MYIISHNSRAALLGLAGILIGCSGRETIGPAWPLPLNQIVIEAPNTLVIGQTLQLKVILLDVSNSPVLDRPVTFTTSNARIARVDASGVVTALAEGEVTITAASEGKSGHTTLTIIHPIRLCAVNSALDQCAGAETYVLVLVDDQPLPVHSPWGVGDWDYGSDAGTWKLVDATITLLASGDFTSVLTHRAASGATISWNSRGQYERTTDSVIFRVDTDAAWSAAILGNSLISQWSDGTKFTYVRSSQIPA